MKQDIDGRLWCAVYCNVRTELIANHKLRAAGYETLFPHYATTVSHANRILPVLRAYFPGYLFAALDTEDDSQSIQAINTSHGVVGVVSTGNGPLWVPPAVIDEWRARALNADGLMERPDDEGDALRKRHKAGAQVRVTAGRFADFLATVALDNGHAVRVWLDLFHRRLPVDLDPIQVEPA